MVFWHPRIPVNYPLFDYSNPLFAPDSFQQARDEDWARGPYRENIFKKRKSHDEAKITLTLPPLQQYTPKSFRQLPIIPVPPSPLKIPQHTPKKGDVKPLLSITTPQKVKLRLKRDYPYKRDTGHEHPSGLWAKKNVRDDEKFIYPVPDHSVVRHFYEIEEDRADKDENKLWPKKTRNFEDFDQNIQKKRKRFFQPPEPVNLTRRQMRIRNLYKRKSYPKYK